MGQADQAAVTCRRVARDDSVRQACGRRDIKIKEITGRGMWDMGGGGEREKEQASSVFIYEHGEEGLVVQRGGGYPIVRHFLCAVALIREHQRELAPFQPRTIPLKLDLTST